METELGMILGTLINLVILLAVVVYLRRCAEATRRTADEARNIHALMRWFAERGG